MKNVELKTKKDENLKGKVFTKNDVKGIIKKNYNPLKVNEKIYEKGSELLSMEDAKIGTIKKISKRCNKKTVLIIKMIEKCNEMGYSIKSIEEFYKE